MDEKENKIKLVDNYTVIDLETGGFSYYDGIIEFAAVRVRNNEVINTFQSLCKPQNPVSSFIEEFTGITNKMLESAASEKDIISKYLDFLGDDIILGHCANFDRNLICTCGEIQLKRRYFPNPVDTLAISRRALPQLEHHRLQDISEYFHIENTNPHRALSDCITTHKCYQALKQYILENNITLKLNKSHKKLDLKTIASNLNAENVDNLLYGKHCVFTGKLKITRAEAAQMIANVGAILENNVTQKTNFLILGNYDYVSTVKDGKSAKLKKATNYILHGQDLTVLNENDFYDLMDIV